MEILNSLSLLRRVVLRMHVRQLERADAVHLHFREPARAGEMCHGSPARDETVHFVARESGRR